MFLGDATLVIDLRCGSGGVYLHPNRVHIPLRGHRDTLDVQGIRDAIKILEDNPNEKVLVHCLHGTNRTGAVIVLWLVSTGVSFDAALQAFINVTGRRPRPAIVTWARRQSLKMFLK
jgi:protein-tyrosine phosphatase